LGAIPSVVTQPTLPQTDEGVRKATSTRAENAKIEKSAKDFESILLGSWLQQAESSFGSVPGGDGEDDEDPGKEQFQGMAMQSLGASMTASGGIGIAKMISKQLHKAEDARVAVAAQATLPPAK
jgi:Rod binding domain-containing protein